MDNKDKILKASDSEIDTLSDDSNISKKPKTCNANRNYKIMNCKVISYNKKSNTLDVLFNGYGIRVKDVQNFDNTIDTVDIQYKGEIGTPNFEYKL